LLEVVIPMKNQTYFWVLVDLFLMLTQTGAVTQGQHADLTCELIETDEELIQISWQKSTIGYRANHNFFFITPSYGPSHVKGRGDRVGFIGNITALVGSIRLGDVSLTDEGVYTCIFTVFPSGPYKTEIHLNVQIPPVISVAVETPPVVAEGQETILATCTAANAKPPAEVRWSTASVRQPLSLTISTNTTLNPDDTTTVRVHLKGEPSRVMHQQEVQCLVNHTTLSQQKVVPYKIDIHYPPNSVKIIVHESAPQAPAFQCLGDANPPPSEFTWKRSTGGLLELVKVGPDFSGLYSCEVSNPYGAASGFLYVHKGNEVFGWLSFGWWTILSTHGKLLSVKTPATLQFLRHSNRCAWHLLPYPVLKALTYFVLHIPPLNGTHTQSMSQLSQGLKILL
uniref:Ig-like domain-containing protein n=1 Tax=Hucho hucho TaxID=62062 RepID=A0A4W5QRG8_9TELE